jgi:DNA-directed RNA polymerase alpha subunit
MQERLSHEARTSLDREDSVHVNPAKTLPAGEKVLLTTPIEYILPETYCKHLRACKITTVGELQRHSLAEITRMRGMGVRRADNVEELLKAEGYNLR